MQFSAMAFGGLLPVVSPRLLGDGQSQTAENCELDAGTMVPLTEPADYETLPDDQRITIFPYNGQWLSWTTDVDVVPSPVLNDAFSQIFYTGSGTPKVRAIVSGVETEYELGVPAPTNAITPVAVAKATQGWTRSWRYQYEEPDGTISQSGTLAEGNYTDTLKAGEALSNPSGTITRLTAESHGFAVGDTCIVSGFTSGPPDLTGLNGTHVIVAVATDTLDIDTGSYTAGTQAGTESLLGQVNEVTAGKEYRMHTIPAKGGAVTSDAVFVLLFDAYDGTRLLGRVYPTISAQNNSRDFYLDGSRANATQVNVTGSNPEATYTLTYDTSRIQDYKAERAWLYTFETVLGKEGPPSPVSDIVAIDPTQDADLSNFDTSVAGRTDISLINIYRTVVDSNTGVSDYQFVKSISLGTATTTDDVSDGSTGQTLRSGGQTWRPTWIAPPDDLKGLTLMPGRFMAGFSGKTLHLTPPDEFHAWPAAYDVPFDYEIVAIGVTENTLIVTTKGRIYAVTGNTPDAVTAVELPLAQGCANKRSMTFGKEALFYASPDGLVACRGATAVLVTQEYYDKETWDPVVPSSMISAFHNGRYYGWATGQNIMMDFGESPAILTTTTETVQGSYLDRERDTLYVIQGDQIRVWKGSSTPLTARWRSKLFHYSREESPYIVRVYADNYDSVNVVFRSNGDIVLTLPITDSEARKIPTLRKEKTWDVEVQSTAPVHEFTIAESMSEI